MAKLRMIDSSGREQIYDIEPAPKLFGHGEDCDVILGSRSVLRHHMHVWEDESGVWVKDLSDGRDMLLNGSPIQGSFNLKKGDKLKVGSFTFSPAEEDSSPLLSDKGAEEAQPIALLKGIRGPTKNVKIVLRRGANDIGRDVARYLVIDDLSISRLHAELIVDKHGSRLIDKGSANGTFVNQKRIEECILESGDLLRLGRVEFQFLHGPKTSRGMLRIRHKKLVVMGLGVLLGLVVVLLVLFSGQRTAPKKPNQASVVFTLEERFEGHLARANALMKEHQWDLAQAEIGSALELFPISNEAKKLRRLVQSEKDHEEIFEQAVAAFNLGDWKEALTLFEKIPVESLYSGLGREKRREAEQKQAEKLLKEARGLYKVKQFAQSYQTLLAYMKIRPCDEQVEKDWVRKVEIELKTKRMGFSPFVSSCLRPTFSGDSRTDSDQVDGLGLLRQQYNQEELFEPMVHYLNGKVEQAIQMLQISMAKTNDPLLKSKAHQLAQQMQGLVQEASDGLDLLQAGEIESARIKLEEVLKKDRILISPPLTSWHGKEILRRLAEQEQKTATEEKSFGP